MEDTMAQEQDTRIRILDSRDSPTLREVGLYMASAKEKKP